MVLSILILFFLGKFYYDLAKNHGKTPWVYAIVGIAVYYAGTFVGGFILGMILAFVAPQIIEEYSDFQLGLMVLPIAILIYYVVYRIIKNRFEKVVVVSEDILDDGFTYLD